MRLVIVILIIENRKKARDLLFRLTILAVVKWNFVSKKKSVSEAHCFWGSDFQFHRNETKKIVESGVVKNTLGAWCFLMSASYFRTPLVGDFYDFFVKPPWNNNETGIVWSNLNLVYLKARCKYPSPSQMPPPDMDRFPNWNYRFL